MMNRRTNELDSGVVTWSVADLDWYRGPMKVDEDETVWCEPLEPKRLSLSQSLNVFNEFAEVGKGFEITSLSIWHPWTVKAITQEAEQNLEAFIESYGVPVDYPLEIPVSISVTASTSQLFAHQGPVGQLNDIKINAVLAAACSELLDHVQNRRRTQIQNSLDESPLLAAITNPPPTTNTYEQWKSYALDVLWENACVYTPSIGIKYQRTKTGRQSVCVLNGLRTAMWLSFQMSLPGEDYYITKKCLDGEHSQGEYHGCGRMFQTTNPRERYCPECKASMAAIHKRAQRQKAAQQKRTMEN